MHRNVHKFHLFIGLLRFIQAGTPLSYIAMRWHMSAYIGFYKRTIQVIWYVKNLCENVENNVCYQGKANKKYFTQTLFTLLELNTNFNSRSSINRLSFQRNTHTHTHTLILYYEIYNIQLFFVLVLFYVVILM